MIAVTSGKNLLALEDPKLARNVEVRTSTEQTREEGEERGEVVAETAKAREDRAEVTVAEGAIGREI